jgi:predicted phosphodiesterase
MKIAILSDIHSNLAALQAVLKDSSAKGGVSAYWCLGDIVDYGPDPHECLEIVRQLEGLVIAGNHDCAVTGKMDINEFPAPIAVVTRWTREQLNLDELTYLSGLPLSVTEGEFTLVHGSPRDPLWEYIMSEKEARENLDKFQTAYCLIGHTHVPMYFHFPPDYNHTSGSRQAVDPRSMTYEDWHSQLQKNKRGEETVRLDGGRYIINPGGVGQPRDGDPRAAYAVYDSASGTVELRRVEYDVRATQQHIRSRACLTG